MCFVDTNHGVGKEIREGSRQVENDVQQSAFYYAG